MLQQLQGILLWWVTFFIILSKLVNFKDLIGHFTVTWGNKTEVDIVLIQPFLLYYVNHVFLIQTGIFKQNFHKKRKEVCIKTRSTSALLSLKGWDSKLTTVNWFIVKDISDVLDYLSFHRLLPQENFFKRVNGVDLDRQFAPRVHMTLFLWKWKLYYFTFKKQLVGIILKKIIVIWFWVSS